MAPTMTQGTRRAKNLLALPIVDGSFPIQFESFRGFLSEIRMGCWSRQKVLAAKSKDQWVLYIGSHDLPRDCSRGVIGLYLLYVLLISGGCRSTRMEVPS